MLNIPGYVEPLCAQAISTVHEWEERSIERAMHMHIGLVIYCTHGIRWFLLVSCYAHTLVSPIDSFGCMQTKAWFERYGIQSGERVHECLGACVTTAFSSALCCMLVCHCCYELHMCASCMRLWKHWNGNSACAVYIRALLQSVRTLARMQRTQFLMVCPILAAQLARLHVVFVIGF